jgi:hypothetical protein
MGLVNLQKVKNKLVIIRRFYVLLIFTQESKESIKISHN